RPKVLAAPSSSVRLWSIMPAPLLRLDLGGLDQLGAARDAAAGPFGTPRPGTPRGPLALSPAGPPATTASPTAARRSFTVSTLSTLTNSSCRRATIGAGVPAGAKKPSP